MSSIASLSRRALIAGAAACLATHASADDDVRSEILRVDGAERRYRLVRPANLPAQAPLVIALHGAADDPGAMARYSHLDDAARAHGWLLAYPRAQGSRWPYFSDEASAREVVFIRTLIDTLASDPDRVHLTGMSGGGYFINYAAARLSERIASIAAHSGGAGRLALEGINAARKYPVFVIHGGEDRVVRVEEGRALAALYLREGHLVEYWEVPRLGHRWAYAQGANDRIAAFFASNPR